MLPGSRAKSKTYSSPLFQTQLLQSGAAGGFGQSSADLIEMKGYTREVAGFTSSARNSKFAIQLESPRLVMSSSFLTSSLSPSVLPICLTPIIGILVDRFVHRFHLTAAAPLFWITSCAVIGWSSIHPLVAVVIASLGGTVSSFLSKLRLISRSQLIMNYTLSQLDRSMPSL